MIERKPYTLSADEYGDALLHADRLWTFNKKQGRKDQATTEPDKKALTVRGQLGEDSVALLRGLQRNRRVLKERDTRPGDLWDPELGWLEVKTRGERGYDFPLESRVPRFDADVGVLVWPTRSDHTWDIIGAASRSTILAKAVMCQMGGKRPTLIVPWREFLRGATASTPVPPEQTAPLPAPALDPGLLQVPTLECKRCRTPTLLGARIKGEVLCASCWHAAGEPWPKPMTEEQA